MADATTPATQITQYQVGYAPEIAPYAQGLLGQAAGMTYNYRDASGNIQYQPQLDANGQPVLDSSGKPAMSNMPVIQGFQPYQQYQGEQNAQFSPLQQQSFAGAQNMQTAPQLGGASQIAGMASLGALGTNYNYTPQSGLAQNPNTGMSNISSYMNPYLQASLAPQMALLNQQQGAQGQQNAAQATQAGAFGNSRFGVQNAAQNQANQLAMSNLVGQGYNTAYNNAQNQFNTENQLGTQNAQFGANLGLQGLNTALQGANTLGTLGQTQYGQQMGINQLQNQYGGQEQQQMQNVLNTQYQNFLNQQNYPYKQMGFLSDLVNKLPMSTQAQSMYQAPPSMLSQVGGLGIAATGLLGKTAAKGGSTKDIRAKKSNGIVDLALKKMEPINA
jgi:hypothetical protein